MLITAEMGGKVYNWIAEAYTEKIIIEFRKKKSTFFLADKNNLVITIKDSAVGMENARKITCIYAAKKKKEKKKRKKK